MFEHTCLNSRRPGDVNTLRHVKIMRLISMLKVWACLSFAFFSSHIVKCVFV